MEAVAEGLWRLADYHEKQGELGKAIKCLEAICQSPVSFFPVLEVKTRLRIATLLLTYSHNVNHAKSHLERSQLLLKSIPSCFELKCRAYSLLSQCYHLVGAIPPQKQLLYKGLDLTNSAGHELSVKLWSCNFNSQLANALIIEGDYQNSISALESGYVFSAEICYPELQMFFATSILHVHLMQWYDDNSVQQAVNKCDEVWESIEPEKRQQCVGLLFYNELLHIFYRLRICDYKNAAQHLDKLDAAMKADLQQTQYIEDLNKEMNALNQSLSRSDLHYKDRLALTGKHAQLQEQLRSITRPTSLSKESLEPGHFGNVRRTYRDKLELAPYPIDGEWLPKSAVYALVDLMVVIFSRPKGLFKECTKRILSGMLTIQEELVKLGIADGVRAHPSFCSATRSSPSFYQTCCEDLPRIPRRPASEPLMSLERGRRFPPLLLAHDRPPRLGLFLSGQQEVSLQHSAIWMAGVYLMLIMQLLENKVAIELTRSEFVEAQEALVQMKNWFLRFPTILQACESMIEMLRGQYAHYVGCYHEATFHYIEAAKLTESKSIQAMCQVYAAVSYICIGDAESSTLALDLIGPVYSMMDSFVGVREKTSVLFAYGLLLMKQHDLQEARRLLETKVKQRDEDSLPKMEMRKNRKWSRWR
ncbi:sister chromatid cohesion protein SCC4 isoform X4 [Cucumis sativus]|uniref:sister chromatid cohesion protein SCC4 isoform X4 n=1 Tax=Cucumis sativus TaxID=3659 RepID=UPI0012F49D3E|nr:sister chromatid cohesion protein SCC4 isoform X4 [Cucumis sativus]